MNIYAANSRVTQALIHNISACMPCRWCGRRRCLCSSARQSSRSTQPVSEPCCRGIYFYEITLLLPFIKFSIYLKIKPKNAYLWPFLCFSFTSIYPFTLFNPTFSPLTLILSFFPFHHIFTPFPFLSFLFRVFFHVSLGNEKYICLPHSL